MSDNNVTTLVKGKALADVGLKILKQGYPVLICTSTKAPLDSKGHKAAIMQIIRDNGGLHPKAEQGAGGSYLHTSDPEAVKLLARLPGAGLWGVPTGKASGLYVIDPDFIDKPDARPWYDENRHWLEATRTHKTMSGATHHLFKWQPGLGNFKLSNGVDSRGDGGYVIFPPSPGYFLQGKKTKVTALPPEFHAAKRHGDDERAKRSTAQLYAALSAGEDWHDNILTLTAKAAAAGEDMSEVEDKIIRICERCVTKKKRRSQQRLDQLMAGELDRAIAGALAKYDRGDADGELEQAFRDMPLGEQAAAPSGAVDADGAAVNLTYWAGDIPHGSLDNDTIEDLLEAGATSLIYGKPGAGKSFMALDMFAHVASDLDWMGRYVRKGPVLYVCAEGQAGFKRRLEAWKAKHNPEELDLYVYEGPVNVAEHSFASPENREFVDALIERGVHYSAIVFDTLQAVTGGASLNDKETVTMAQKFVADLHRYMPRTHVCFIHHEAKATGDVYGSTFIRAVSDQMFRISQEQDSDVREMRVERQKDFDTEGVLIPFTLSSVELEMSKVHPRTGEVHLLSSAVVMPAKSSDMGLEQKYLRVGEVIMEMAETGVILPTTGPVSEQALGRVDLVKSEVTLHGTLPNMLGEVFGIDLTNWHARDKSKFWKNVYKYNDLIDEHPSDGRLLTVVLMG